MIESTRNQLKQCPQGLVVISASPMLLLRCYVFHKHLRFHWMLVLDVICCDLCFFFHFTHTHTHVHIHNGVTLTYMWELETDLQEDFFNNVCPGHQTQVARLPVHFSLSHLMDLHLFKNLGKDSEHAQNKYLSST